MDPGSHRCPAIEKFLSGLQVKGFQDSGMAGFHTLFGASALHFVRPRGKREHHTIGNHGGIRHIEIARNPDRLEYWGLGLWIRHDSESHQASMWGLAIRNRKFRAFRRRTS